MEIIKTEDFFIQEGRFRENPQDPRLHIKKVEELPLALPFRITRRYRALLYFRDVNTTVIFDLDHRKDVYRF